MRQHKSEAWALRVLGKYSKHSGEIRTYTQCCSEGFVCTVYRAIKAAVSFARAGGNLVLLSFRGLRNPTQKNRTHPKVLPKPNDDSRGGNMNEDLPEDLEHPNCCQSLLEVSQ